MGFFIVHLGVTPVTRMAPKQPMSIWMRVRACSASRFPPWRRYLKHDAERKKLCHPHYSKSTVPKLALKCRRCAATPSTRWAWATPSSLTTSEWRKAPGCRRLISSNVMIWAGSSVFAKWTMAGESSGSTEPQGSRIDSSMALVRGQRR